MPIQPSTCQRQTGHLRAFEVRRAHEEYSAALMPSRAQALTPSATPTAPLLTKKASSPPVSAFAGWGRFTPPATGTVSLRQVVTADEGGISAIRFCVCRSGGAYPAFVLIFKRPCHVPTISVKSRS